MVGRRAPSLASEGTQGEPRLTRWLARRGDATGPAADPGPPKTKFTIVSSPRLRYSFQTLRHPPTLPISFARSLARSVSSFARLALSPWFLVVVSRALFRSTLVGILIVSLSPLRSSSPAGPRNRMRMRRAVSNSIAGGLFLDRSDCLFITCFYIPFASFSSPSLFSPFLLTLLSSIH